MATHRISRRSILKGGSGTAALAGLSVVQVAGPERGWAQTAGEVLPWLDQPAPNPYPGDVLNLLKWESLDTWRTPTHNFFSVNHYGTPTELNEESWRVGIAGLVDRPRSLTLDDIKGRPKHEVDFTLECSGNHGIGLDFFIGGIGNATWGGARLAPLLEQSGLSDEATEVIFWGYDRDSVTIRDNSGVVAVGQTGTGQPDSEGGIDLTITEQFARSMSLSDALNRDNLICYEMNDERLPADHGFPLRLIAPGWYGVANVKWLTRIEVTSRRFAGRFMSRDYVSIREEQRDGQAVWTFATVGRDRLKSAPAKVTRTGTGYTIMGAAWGAPVAAVEVQIDAGTWMRARLDDRVPRSRSYSWRFWTLNWDRPASGEHRIRSRAIDLEGNVQPPPDDAFSRKQENVLGEQRPNHAARNDPVMSGTWNAHHLWTFVAELIDGTGTDWSSFRLRWRLIARVGQQVSGERKELQWSTQRRNYRLFCKRRA